MGDLRLKITKWHNLFPPKQIGKQFSHGTVPTEAWGLVSVSFSLSDSRYSTASSNSTHDHLPSSQGGHNLKPHLGKPEEVSNVSSRSVGLVPAHVPHPIRHPTHTPNQTHGRTRNLIDLSSVACFGKEPRKVVIFSERTLNVRGSSGQRGAVAP